MAVQMVVRHDYSPSYIEKLYSKTSYCGHFEERALISGQSEQALISGQSAMYFSALYHNIILKKLLIGRHLLTLNNIRHALVLSF